MTRNPRGNLALALFTTIVFIVLYGPICVPIASSFFALRQGAVDWRHPTAQAYIALISNEGILVALRNTLMVGAAAVVLSLVLATASAFYVHGGKSKDRAALQFIIFLPFLMPPIITGLSLLIFFREISFDRSMATVIIGHTVFVLALAYRIILVRLQSLSRSLSEASYDLGASGFQTFRYVLLPNLSSAMIGAGILSFALSFDETMITFLVTGTDNTLPIRLWAMMRLGFTPDINALVAIILMLTAAMCLLATRYLMPKDAA